MAKASENKKFITLDDVKVYYNRKENTIQLISSDEDLVGKPFQITLNQGTESENSLRELLHSKGVITVDESNPVASIPKYAPMPSKSALAAHNPSWSKVPLGLGEDKARVAIDLKKSAHTLIVGHAGSGKSIFQRIFFLQCLRNPDRWRFLGIDLQQGEYKEFSKFKNNVLGIATTLEDAVAALRSMKQLMLSRLLVMEKNGVNHFTKLRVSGEKPYAVMVMIDELALLTVEEGIKTEEGIKQDELHREAKELVTSISQLGRASGFYLVVFTQLLYFTGNGELFNNFSTRIQAGKASEMGSKLLFNSNLAVNISNVRGRSFIKSDVLVINDSSPSFGVAEFQMYYAPTIESFETQSYLA